MAWNFGSEEKRKQPEAQVKKEEVITKPKQPIEASVVASSRKEADKVIKSAAGDHGDDLFDDLEEDDG